MRYMVIAVKWDDEKKSQIEYVAGTFDTYMNAKIFKDAYNSHYCSNARIAEVSELFKA